MAYKIGSSGGGGGTPRVVYANFATQQHFMVNVGIQTIIFDAAPLDPNSEYNTTTGEFTASESGAYIISGAMGLDASLSVATTSIEVTVWLNDTAVILNNYVDVTGLDVSAFYIPYSVDFSLTLNDTISFYIDIISTSGDARAIKAVAATTAGGFMSILKCP